MLSFDFIVHFMTCMLKHINATMQAFTRITGSICSCICLVIRRSAILIKKLIYIILLVEDTIKERDKGE